MKRLGFAAVVVLLLASGLFSQNPSAQAARVWRQAHEHAIVQEFVELVRIPNLAADPANLRKNAAAVQQMLEKRGVRTRLLETAGAPPVVYGEILTPGATRTLVFYAHYDGQPLDPKEWATPPFDPVLRDGPLDRGGKVIPLPPEGQAFNPEWRIYGRSSGDDKVTIMAFAAALDALRQNQIPLKSNVKFVIEGEEEASSIHLDKILAANRDLVRGDVWLIGDGPMHPSRQQQLLFGVRGIQTINITVYGARRELHSGHYGNWAPNPAMMLAQLLASMKDATGRVLIDHFYDGMVPLGPAELRAIAAAPDNDEALKREFWLGGTEGGGKKLLELLMLPSLNVRGMASSRIGAQASNVIPSTATATIDMRLVNGIGPQEAVARVVEHIRQQGYFVVNADPDEATRLAHPKVAKVEVEAGGYSALRTPMDLPISKLVIDTVESARRPVIKLPSMGASVPLFMINETVGSPTIIVPIANHDDNQHTFNENLRLQNLWDGIELYAALFSM
jgi:acetylornithine deacetylase/succinyl-diaminopimelate desuccinylase-like protein